MPEPERRSSAVRPVRPRRRINVARLLGRKSLWLKDLMSRRRRGADERFEDADTTGTRREGHAASTHLRHTDAGGRSAGRETRDVGIDRCRQRVVGGEQVTPGEGSRAAARALTICGARAGCWRHFFHATHPDGERRSCTIVARITLDAAAGRLAAEALAIWFRQRLRPE